MLFAKLALCCFLGFFNSCCAKTQCYRTAISVWPFYFAGGMINNYFATALQWARIKKYTVITMWASFSLKNDLKKTSIRDWLLPLVAQNSGKPDTVYRTHLCIHISSIHYHAVGNLTKSNRLDIKSAFVNPLCKHQAACSAFISIKGTLNTKF